MPPLTPDALPWYQFLSIDLIIRVLRTTFFHPLLAWICPLALRAQAYRMHMRPLQISIAFALLVDFFWFLGRLNVAARNGRFSRAPKRAQRTEFEDEKGRFEEEEEDVVVVTGGSSGLGQLVAEIFALKGISVAILDVKKPQLEGNYAIEYYECDVSDVDSIKRAAQQIRTDVFSPPLFPAVFSAGFSCVKTDGWKVGNTDRIGELCCDDCCGREAR
jgi:short chain dehydrogenase